MVTLSRTITRSDDASGYFRYDPRNLVNRVTDGVGGRTYFAYDAVGNRTQIVDPRNHATNFQYDARNLLSEVVAPDGGLVYFRYDGSGNNTKGEGNGDILQYRNALSALARSRTLEEPSFRRGTPA